MDTPDPDARRKWRGVVAAKGPNEVIAALLIVARDDLVLGMLAND